MLQIRPSQIAAIEAASAAEWRAALVPDMRRIWPDRTERLDDAAVREWIDDACRRAEGHGLETEEHLARFVHLTFAFGRHFDRELPWARGVLTRRDLSAAERIALVWSFARERAAAGGRP
jgi:hypothetical protein